MTPSSHCIALIRKREGCYTTAYICPAGVPTIGIGHTKGVKMGDVITEKAAENLLMQDLADSVRDIKRLVKVPLTQGQFDALCSFFFNVGGGDKVADSDLLRYLNAGDYAKAAKEFDRWIYSNKKVLPGLVKRRADEKKLFMS